MRRPFLPAALLILAPLVGVAPAYPAANPVVDSQAPVVDAAVVDSKGPETELSDARSAAAAEFLEARLLAARGSLQAALERYGRADELLPGDPWPDLERARLLLRLREVPAAIRLAEEVVLRAPELLQARELLAQARLTAAESDPSAVPAAEEALRAVLERSSYDPSHAFDLARLLQSQGRLDEAIDVLGTATTLRPDPRLQSIQVRLMLEVGREGDAEVVLRELLELAPGALEERLLLVEILSRRGDHGLAAEVLGAAPDLGDEPRLVRRLAWEQARAGKVAEALTTIEELVADGSADARLRLLQGEMLERSGRVEEAEEVFRAALELDPPSGDVALALAAILERRGDFASASAMLLATAQRLAAGDDSEGADELRLRLAGAQLAAGDADGALAVLDGLADPVRGLELSLDALLARGKWEEVVARAGSGEVSGAVEARRAEALYRLGRRELGDEAMARLLTERSDSHLRLAVVVYQRLGEHEKAIPVLVELQERDPESVEIPFRRGAALERIGRYEEAEQVFRQLISRAPDLHTALNYLGYMFAERGENLEEALGLVERAVELEPENGSYRDSLGWVLYRLGRHREALSQLELAARLTPGEPTILDHLGDVLLALGQTTPALEAWARALEQGVEDPEAVRRKIEAARGDG